MSIEALTWAWRQETGNATSKLVLLAIADHANGDGYCWPSMLRIAAMAGVSTRQVSRHVAALAELGLVEKAERRRGAAGQYRGWTYRVPVRPADLDDERTPTSAGRGRPVSTGPLGSSREDVGVRSEPSGNRKGEPAPTARRRDELFEVVVEVSGHRLDRLTRTERGRVNKAVKELREADATPDDVRAAAREWRRIHPEATLTATALSANWSRLASATPTSRPTCAVCGGPLDGHTDELCRLFER